MSSNKNSNGTNPVSSLFELILEEDQRIPSIHLELSDFLTLHGHDCKYDDIENFLNEFQTLIAEVRCIMDLMFKIKVTGQRKL